MENDVVRLNALKYVANGVAIGVSAEDPSAVLKWKLFPLGDFMVGRFTRCASSHCTTCVDATPKSLAVSCRTVGPLVGQGNPACTHWLRPDGIEGDDGNPPRPHLNRVLLRHALPLNNA